jgi:hypothetical protein
LWSPVRGGRPARVKLHGKKREHGQNSHKPGLLELGFIRFDTEWPFLPKPHSVRFRVPLKFSVKTIKFRFLRSSMRACDNYGRRCLAAAGEP